ncbi:hypothetical protein D3C76_1146650 [compost metagenome]
MASSELVSKLIDTPASARLVKYTTPGWPGTMYAETRISSLVTPLSSGANWVVKSKYGAGSPFDKTLLGASHSALFQAQISSRRQVFRRGCVV